MEVSAHIWTYPWVCRSIWHSSWNRMDLKLDTPNKVKLPTFWPAPLSTVSFAYQMPSPGHASIYALQLITSFQQHV